MAATFPTSPINGEYAVVNSITYVYASAQQAWTRVPGSGGGGGTPGGLTTQIQFNDAATFAGSAGFTFDKVSNAVAVVGNITGSNLTTVGQVTATGNISGGNLIVSGNIVDTAGLTIITGSNGNIALAPDGTGIVTSSKAVVVTGNITGSNLITSGILSVTSNIVSTGSNGVANIGSATTYFNTVHAKATSAQYADLAEMYQGDCTYMPGTVVEFGGSHEVTITTTESTPKIAGVVSTNPSYLMNSGLNSLNSVPVALTGRVPCQVLGPVKKGDCLVSSTLPGVAQALDEKTYRPGCMIGKSLENWPDASVKLIEVVVGRL